MTQEHSNFAMD